MLQMCGNVIWKVTGKYLNGISWKGRQRVEDSWKLWNDGNLGVSLVILLVMRFCRNKFWRKYSLQYSKSSSYPRKLSLSSQSTFITISRIHDNYNPLKSNINKTCIPHHQTKSTGKLLSHIIKFPSLSAQKVDIPSTLNSKKASRHKSGPECRLSRHMTFSVVNAAAHNLCRISSGCQARPRRSQQTTERLKIFSRKIDGYFYTPTFIGFACVYFRFFFKKKSSSKIKIKKSRRKNQKKIPQSETSFFCLLP